MVFRAIDPQASDSAMAPPEERQCSDSAMTTTEMFAMILAKLEETNAQLHTLVEPSPSSISNERKTEVANSTTSTAAPPAAQDVSLVVPVANSDYSEREIDITIGAGFSFQCSDSPRSARVAASENAATTISKPATSSSTSSMSSLTSAPSLEVPPVIPSATTDHIWDTPPRCSTFCQDQDTGNWKAVHSSSASPTPSLPSGTPRGVDNTTFIASSENAAATPTRCSMLGFYQVARMLVPADKSWASPMSTQTSKWQDVTSNIPATTTDHVQVQRVWCSTSVYYCSSSSATLMSLCQTVCVLESAPSPLYNTCGQELDTSSNISASSKAMVLLCPDASTGDAYKVFKVLPLFLFLPPANCFDWNLHSGAELRSMALLLFKLHKDGKFLKHRWPPPLQVETDDLQGLVWLHEFMDCLVDSFTSDTKFCVARKPHFPMAFNVDKCSRHQWLLCIVSSSWLGNIQCSSEFLLHVQPGCSENLTFLQWQPSMTPPVQLKQKSRAREIPGLYPNETALVVAENSSKPGPSRLT